VHKHGKGQSLNELAASYPQYLRKPFGGLPIGSIMSLDHEWLELSDSQFDDIATALREFWVSFPERLFMT
jgi:hypothetical protein